MSSNHHGVRVYEAQDGIRSIPTIETAVDGIVVIAPDAQGALTAAAEIGIESANTGLTATAKVAGVVGNDAAITLKDPGVAESALAVSVDGKLVTVSLETDVGGALVSTAAEVLAAVNGEATAPFTLAHTGASDGSGVMGIVRRTYLSGGEDEPFPLGEAVLLAGNKAKFDKLDTTGAGAGSLLHAKGIWSQGRPVVIVVRVAEGVDQGATDANVIAGIETLMAARASVGLQPRNIGAPGLDTYPVAKAIEAQLDDYRAFGYVAARAADGTAIAPDKEAADAYQNKFASKRLMVIWPEWLVFDTVEKTTLPVSAIGYALSLRAKIDDQVGWHKTLSNVAVETVSGISKTVSFGIQNPNTDANYLNQAGVTTLVQMNGFRFWGNRTCSDDPMFIFESATRTGDVLADSIAEAHAWAIDKPMSKTLIQEILEGVNAKFRELKAQGYIVDANAWIDPEKNTNSVLALGQLWIDYDYTPVPPLESLNFTAHITTSYLAQLVSE